MHVFNKNQLWKVYKMGRRVVSPLDHLQFITVLMVQGVYVSLDYR